MPDLIAQGVERNTVGGGRCRTGSRSCWDGGGAAGPSHGTNTSRAATPACSGTAAAGGRPAAGRPESALSPRHALDRFSLGPGEHFVIGQTTFTLADQQVNVTADAPAPVQQHPLTPQYLKQVQFRNPDHRIEVLSRLPDVISGAAGDEELFVRLVSMLLAGVPRADAAAVVAVEIPPEGWDLVPRGMAEKSEVRDFIQGSRGQRSEVRIGKIPNPKSQTALSSSPLPSPSLPFLTPRPPLGPAAGDCR